MTATIPSTLKLTAPLVPFLLIFDQAQQVLAGACVVVFQFVFKISMPFVCDSGQQRHHGGPQRHGSFNLLMAEKMPSAGR